MAREHADLWSLTCSKHAVPPVGVGDDGVSSSLGPRLELSPHCLNLLQVAYSTACTVAHISSVHLYSPQHQGSVGLRYAGANIACMLSHWQLQGLSAQRITQITTAILPL